MTSITPLVFTGISKHSEDFQTVLSRAVSIASLPIKQLQNEQTNVLARKQVLTNLGMTVLDLGSKLAELGDLAETRAVKAVSSNSARVSVSVAGTSPPARYTLSEITSIASSAAETSLSGFAAAGSTPVSAGGSLRLVHGGAVYDITLSPENNHLLGLRDAINSLGAGVTAAILTTGTGENPNFLSISANSTGSTTLRLVDDPEGAAADLLTASNQGTNAVFKLNGLPVERSGNFVNDLVPGVIFTIAGKTDPGETVVLTLSTSRTRLSEALADFVQSYNLAAKEVDAQVGKGAGMLSGDFLVREVQEYLREIASFGGAGEVKGLSDLGIVLNDKGEMSFDSQAFESLSDAKIEAAFAFLGTRRSGFAGISAKLGSLTDPVSGLIRMQQDEYDKTDQRFQGRINEMTDRVIAMQTMLSAKLQAADVLLARLDSQQSLLAATIDSLNFATFGRKQDS